eukprot:344983-Prorocentrum_lima.AAC.1
MELEYTAPPMGRHPLPRPQLPEGPLDLNDDRIRPSVLDFPKTYYQGTPLPGPRAYNAIEP